MALSTAPYIAHRDLRAYLQNIPAGTTELVPAEGGNPAITVNDLLDAIGARVTSLIDEVLDERGAVHFGGYAAPAAALVLGWGGSVLVPSAHLIGSVTQVVYTTWAPAGWVLDNWEEQPDGGLYRRPGGVQGLSAGFLPDYPLPGYPDYAGSPYGGYPPIWRASAWPAGRYQVTAAYGYGPPPAALVQIALELGVNIWRLKDQGLWQQTLGVEGTQGTLRYLGGLSAQQRLVIAAIKQSAVLNKLDVVV